jgi:hypothetical protein
MAAFVTDQQRSSKAQPRQQDMTEDEYYSFDPDARAALRDARSVDRDRAIAWINDNDADPERTGGDRIASLARLLGDVRVRTTR